MRYYVYSLTLRLFNGTFIVLPIKKCFAEKNWFPIWKTLVFLPIGSRKFELHYLHLGNDFIGVEKLLAQINDIWSWRTVLRFLYLQFQDQLLQIHIRQSCSTVKWWKSRFVICKIVNITTIKFYECQLRREKIHYFNINNLQNDAFHRFFLS
jgi:hypothetical protein